MMEFYNWELIGQGGFSNVYKARDKKTNEIYAIKKVETKSMTAQELKYFNNEKNILRTAVLYNIKQIVKLVNVIKYPDTGIYYLVLEYCNGGSLHENLYKYYYKYGKPFPEDLVSYIMKQVIIGLKNLHNRGIIHRDLKLGNILLKYNNEIDKQNINIYAAEIKIIDFNTSYYPDPLNVSEPKTVLGTVPNMAPSVIKNHFGSEQIYDEKIDIWSLGTMCYEMLFCQPLFVKDQELNIMKNIYHGNFTIPYTVSSDARSFLLSMLQQEGKNRLSCEQLLNHTFIVANQVNMSGIYNYNNLSVISGGNINQSSSAIFMNKQREILTNVLFKKTSGTTTVIVTNVKTKIKDLIGLFFDRNKNEPDYNYNNISRLKFVYNNKNLQSKYNETILAMNMMNSQVYVYNSMF